MLRCRSLAAAIIAGVVSLGSAHADERIPVRTASLSKTIAPTATVEDSGPVELTGKEARAFQIETLESMIANLSGVSCYTAELMKQERVDGDLTGEQKIDFKLRHANEDEGIATSIYMKWTTGDRGREVIYVDGANNGKMLVHAGGWKARILPVLALDPTGSLAMGESRHPVTEAGLLSLTQKWLDVRQADGELKGVYYEVEPAEFDGHAGHLFTVKYARQQQNETYRKCQLWIDAERNIPLAAVNYTWGTESNADTQTLVERYEYTNVELNAGLADIDFDKTNKRYSFKK